MARTYTDYIIGSTSYLQNQKLERFHYVDDNGYDWSIVSPLVQYSGNVGSVVIQDTQLSIDNLPLNVALSWIDNPQGPIWVFGQPFGTKTTYYTNSYYKGPISPFKNISFSAPGGNRILYIYPSKLYSGKYSLNGLTQGAVEAEARAIDQTQKDASVFQQILTTVAYFAAAAGAVAALTPSAAAAASGSDVGAVATSTASGTTVESAIPTYIAAPTPVSTIPEYIAASTPAAALPVDAALGTDASILGLTGGAAETSSIYGSVENIISQGKDLVAQYKPVISDITKLKTAYDIASGKQPTKPTPVKSTAQTSGTVPRGSTGASGLIPIGIILGLLLLA